MQEATQYLQDENTATIVSDGGMAKGYGSFGWVAEIRGEIIATGRGEAGGSRKLMQSFRAEGYGMLAALTFLKHAYTYNGWPQSNKQIKILCDNLGLIQRIKSKTPKKR